MSSNFARITQVAITLLVGSLITACTGGVSPSPADGSTQYTVGGTVAGLTGAGLVLQSNTGENLPIAADGNFTFKTALTSGSSYYVVVATQPGTPNQTCAVFDASGTIASVSVSNVAVACQNKTTTTDSIGGLVVGASGSGLVLQNNGADRLAIPSDGPFTFPTGLPTNTAYSVSVLSPPINPYQDCGVTNSPGTTAASDVSNVVVSCVVNSNPTHTISVTAQSVTGTVTLENNGRDPLTISSAGTFPFSIPIPSGSAYKVTASAVNGALSESCTLQNATGVVGNSDIDVQVSCTPAMPGVAITASVSGLVGSGLVLQNNGGDNLNVLANGPNTFATLLQGGSAYTVTVLTQPVNPNETCTVINGSGVAGSGGPAPAVNCVPTLYPISVTVNGLSEGSPGLVLQNNGDDNLKILTNGTSSFATRLVSNATYAVTVLTSPTNLNCTVTNGTGTAGTATPVAVNCVPPPLVTISVTVTGLKSSGLVLQDNQTDNLAVANDGTPHFATRLLAGTAYFVSVFTQPTGPPPQTCTVTNASGVAGAGGPTPTVTCVPLFTIGGTVTGLPDPNQGAVNLVNLVLQNSNGDAVLVPEQPPYTFTFGQALPSGSNYSVTVKTQPGVDVSNGRGLQTSTVCVVSNGTGTVQGNVTGIGVNCVQPLGFAYVTNSADNTVSAYLVDQKGGLLASGPPVRTGNSPSGAAVLLGGADATSETSFLYVTNQGSNNLSIYTIDPNTGALTDTGTDTSALRLSSPATATITNGIGTTSGLPTLYVTGSNTKENLLSSLGISNGTTLANLKGSPGGRPGGPPAESTLTPTSTKPEGGGSQNWYIGTLPASDTLLVHLIDANGLPTSGLPIRTGPKPTSAAAQTVAANGITYSVLYVANAGDGTISRYTLSPQGVIAGPAPGTTIGAASVLQLATASFFNEGSTVNCLLATDQRRLWAFGIDATGALRPLPGSPSVTGGSPGPLTSFGGALLYVVDVTGTKVLVFAISSPKGLTRLQVAEPATGKSPSSIVVNPRPNYFPIG